MPTEESNLSNDTSGQENNKDEKVYELGYLLVPTIAPEEAPANYGNLKELVISMPGDVIADEMPKTITLSYPIKKVVANVRSQFTTAYFGWIKFVMDSDKVLELKKRLDLDSSIIRFLILKTVRENTIAAKRFIRGDLGHRKSILKKNENEPVVPINKEEVDKEIEALIAA